jgi:hypothetical protein
MQLMLPRKDMMGRSRNNNSSRHGHHNDHHAVLMSSSQRQRRRRRPKRALPLMMMMSLLILLFLLVASFQYEAVVEAETATADASSENEIEIEIEIESLSSGSSCASSNNVDNDNGNECITGSKKLNSDEDNENKDEEDDEDDEYNENENENDEQCIFDAKKGLCEKYSKDMFQRCPNECIKYSKNIGSIIYLENKNYENDNDNDNDQNSDIEVCKNFIDDEICEEYAHYNELECIKNRSYMYDHCSKSCLKCFDFTNDSSDSSGSTIEINIGVKQSLSPTIDDLPNKDEIINNFLSTIEKTNEYMSQQVMKDDKYISVRKYCHNYNNFCTWGVTTQTQDVFCNLPNMNNKLLCGPACNSCHEMLISEKEIHILYECTPDTYNNIFINDNDDENENENENEDEDERNAEDEDNNNNNNNEQKQKKKITLDTMFQRIIGEVPYPKEYADKVPSFNTTVLSRPTLNLNIHQNMSVNDLNDLDFVLGGPWIIQLDNFLTDEECTRLIELGDIIGRDTSTIEEDDFITTNFNFNKSNSESTNNDENHNDIGSEEDNHNDNDIEEDEDEDDDDDEQWRTSTTAWCKEENCKDDPIAKRVQEKIGFTTSVLDPAYFEHIQLLKYIPGQFYKDHHDESGDQHDIKYNVDGPRIVTFFLYLNDLDDDDDDGGAGAGGETRFTNIFGDETNIYLDVKPKKGRALIWPSMLNEDLNGFEHKTYHEARVVNKGNKYGANAWLHLRDYRNLECDEDELESVKSKLDQIQQQ